MTVFEPDTGGVPADTPKANATPADTPPANAELADAPQANAGPADAAATDTPSLETPLISIFVRRQDIFYLRFLIKVTTPMDRLMKMYCIACGIPKNGVRMWFNGTQLCRQDSPVSLNMRNGDVLQAIHDF